MQHGEAIFHLSASFQVPEEGPEHQDPMPAAPDPETLPTFAERFAPYADVLGDWYWRPRPIDTRHAQPPAISKEPRPPRQQVCRFPSPWWSNIIRRSGQISPAGWKPWAGSSLRGIM